jgi:hypothetical protein
MKKIINKKLYDTETAQEIGNGDNGLGPRDFGYFDETLYRKRTGEFFLYGYGGPASKYAESCGQNQWSGGEKIIPLSVEAAMEWAEKYMSADAYQEVFGPVAEDDSKVVTTISITAETMNLLRRMSEQQGTSVSGIIEKLVKATKE